MLCVLASSIGVAAFHPEASKFAAWLSGERRSTAMSVFSVGGNLGVAIGPLLAGVIAAHYGLGGVWLLAIPGLAIAGVQLAGLAALGGATAHARVATALAGRDRWGATGLLLVALMVRGYVHFGLLTFIPLFEHDARHNSNSYGSRVLALMLFAGAVGTLAIGPVADRYGRRLMLTLTFLTGVPGVALYLADSGVLGLAGIAFAGAGIISTFGLTIVLSQEYLPTRLATAAGLSIGLSIGLGGVASFAIGSLADSIGLTDALWTIPPAALLGTLLCALLPAPDPPRRATAQMPTTETFTADAARDDALDELAERRFDLLVVGGGIVGCAVAWLGAHAGLRVRWWSAATSPAPPPAPRPSSSTGASATCRWATSGWCARRTPSGARSRAWSRRTSCGRVPSSFPSTAAARSVRRSCAPGWCCTAASGASPTAAAACCGRQPRKRSCRRCARRVSARPAATSTTRPTTRA